MKKALSAILVSFLLLTVLAACGGNNSDSKSGDGASASASAGNSSASGDSAGTDSGKQVELQFLQYKPEARETFDKLIAKFEEKYPNIKIVQDNPPDASTVLKTKVAAGEVPDIIANGGDNVFASLAQSDVLADFTGAPELSEVQGAFVDILKQIAETDKVYAIPYGVNANGIIYNKKEFQDLGLAVPTTWDEFVAVCQKIKDAGKLPFYFTFKDSWTTLPAFNAFGASTQEDGFFAKRKAGQTTFGTGYKEAAQRYLEFIAFGQKDNFGQGYNDGNVAFANGKSVMYAQGVWAIPEIKKANPNIELGVFPYPVTNDKSKNKLVSGVDQLLTMSKTTKHPDEAKAFIDFLLEPENATAYVKGVNTFSAVNGVVQDDAAVAELQPVFNEGRVADFPDHYVPSTMKLDQLVQNLILKKNVDGFLKSMDDEYDKALKR